MSRIVVAVEWIGGQGTRAVAFVLFLGLALPPLSAVMRPVLPFAVFGLLVLAFIRVDAMRIRRPRLALIASGWIMLIVPVALALALALSPPSVPPELTAALILMAVAPPVMSSPAIAYLVGLDGTLALTVLVAAMVATPITAPLLVEAFVGEQIGVPTFELALRLSLLLAGSFIVAMMVRRWLGTNRIAAHGRLIDGFNILILFVFAVAIMDGVVASAIQDPLLVLGILALASGINLVLLALSTIAFLRVGIGPSLTIGLASANRNMGLMAGAMTGAIPEVMWLFFALGQFPIFLLPQLMKPAIVAVLRTSKRPVPPKQASD